MSEEDSDEMYSIKSSKTVYKRSRAPSITTRESEYRSVSKIYITSDSDERLGSEIYFPVQRWAVDYNNKNYIRSLCNKNTGLHRKIKGRPLEWHIEYDNNYFIRSKVPAPKGLHRRIPEVKRKYVPDKDDLADATGWEFDCGPEFDQIEEDIPYIPEGRIITRGCYRWYGVKRNDSDCDVKQKEHRENLLNEELVEELKCGQEFLQADVPHMSEQLERKYTRGAYRHYEVQRNAYDIRPEELASASHDVEWKRKYHSNGLQYLDLDMCEYDRDDLKKHYTVKGKPFRRTILNKVYELREIHDPRESSSPRHRTRLSLVPGEGEKTLYEGVSDRYAFKPREVPSIRSVFKKKSERRYKSSKEGNEFEEYEREDTERSYREELGPEHGEKLHSMADRKRGQRRSSYLEEDRDESKSGRGRLQEYTYRVKSEDRNTAGRRNTVTSKRSDMDDFEERRDNLRNIQRQKVQRNHRAKEKGRRENYRDVDYSPRDIVVVKRKNEARGFDYDEHRSQKNKSSRNTKDHHYVDRHAYNRNDKSKSIKQDEVDFEDTGREREAASKHLPPHVDERMKKIRQKMHRKFEQVDHKHKEQSDNQGFSISGSDDDIDLMKHKRHPKDRGQEHNSEYEKYVTKNGSELWIKKEEKYAELHHKDG